MNRFNRMSGANAPKPDPNKGVKPVADKQDSAAILQQSNTATSIAVDKELLDGEVLSQINEAVIQVLRRSLAEVGDQPHSCRLTRSVKRELKDVSYQAEKDGFKCDVNKIVRLGIEYLLLDLRTNGKKGILYQYLNSTRY